MVNAWLWKHTGRRYELDDHLIGKWERGCVRWPIPAYRAALRAILGVASDAALGFRPPTRHRNATLSTDKRWTREAIVRDARTATEWDLLNRRKALSGVAAIGGTALLAPLTHWLEPLAENSFSSRSGAFSLVEVEALERCVGLFRDWRSTGLGRAAVLGQLSDVCERLQQAPPGERTERVFLVAAELAKVAGSMAFDDGAHRAAQLHYVNAARLAKAGGHTSFGAAALAALARQSFDRGAADDGLAIVQLAQRSTRVSATPRLRALLAIREAWAYAQLGDVHRFRSAVDTAEELHISSVESDEPRWLRKFDTAELVGTIGARYRDLAQHKRSHAGQAVEYIGRALELRDRTRTRNRALDLVSLGRAYLLVEAPDRAAATVREALSYLDPCRPSRLKRKVVEWACEAASFARLQDVAEVREHIRELANDRATKIWNGDAYAYRGHRAFQPRPRVREGGR